MPNTTTPRVEVKETPLKDQPLIEYVRENAATQPAHVAVIFGDKRLTYEELMTQVGQLAAYLSTVGVKRGSHVALFMQNSPQFIIGSLAIQWLGGVVCPCNPMYKAWELEYQLNDLEAEVLITFDDLAPVFNEVKQSHVKNLIVTRWIDVADDILTPPVVGDEVIAVAEGVTLQRWLDIVHGDREIPDVAAIDMLNDPALIIYTSGTTGKPKGAMLSYKNAEFKTAAIVHNFGFTSTDIFCSVMPIFHIAGMVVGMNSPLMVGGTIVLEERFDPEKYLHAVKQHKATVLYTTPPMLLDLLEQPEATRETFKTVRLHLGTSFGIQISKELSDRFEELADCAYFEWAYGMSEAHTGNTLMPLDGIRYGCHGRAAPDTIIRISDPSAPVHEMPNGELGEILIKSPAVFLGYLGRPDETDAVFYEGYYRTGDLGRLDSELYLHFEGRTKELIKSSGYSVFPEEVEGLMTRHDDVLQTGVIGFPDPKRGESVKAYVVRRPGATCTEDELVKWARERMSAYKYPREVEFIEELPMTTTGKLQRMKLRERDAESREL